MFITSHPILFNEDFSNYFKNQKILLWDIETLGLSYQHPIYMIGLIKINTIEKKSTFFQGMIENLEDEMELISWFLNLVQGTDLFIHFNGQRFDHPFLLKRAEKYNITTKSLIPEADLLKLFRKRKKLYNLPSLTQKTIESLLSIKREDQYNGKELISIMKDYLKMPSEEKKEVLLCHNREDILGLYELLKFYPVFDFFDSPDWSDLKYLFFEDYIEINIKLKFRYPINQRIHHLHSHIIFNQDSNMIKIKIPISSDTMKLYFKDYKNYYYLPLEDMAIHKSTAQYVDSEYKEKAKQNNCYQKIEGLFIPSFGLLSEQLFFNSDDIEKKYPYLLFDKDTFSEIVEDYTSALFQFWG